MLTITVGEAYPETIPTYSFAPLHHGRWFTVEREKKILQELKSMFDPQDSGNIMRVIEWIRESAYVELDLSEEDLQTPNQGKNRSFFASKEGSANLELSVPVPTIYHSHRITDRKSKFQAHFSRCYSEKEVRMAIQMVRDDPKCSEAIHPCIYAWRLEGSTSGEILDGSSDDGEGGAAAFLENLLQTRNISNGLLMVTRWYGGTLLGPDRFRHISSISEFILNRSFDPTWSTKESVSSKPGGNQQFTMLLSAAECLRSVGDSDSKDCLLQFKTAGSDAVSAPIKWTTYSANRTAYPVHRLMLIQSSSGVTLWSNYSPQHIKIEE